MAKKPAVPQTLGKIPAGGIALPDNMYGVGGYRVVTGKESAKDYGVTGSTMARIYPNGNPTGVYVSGADGLPPETIALLAAAVAKFQ